MVEKISQGVIFRGEPIGGGVPCTSSADSAAMPPPPPREPAPFAMPLASLPLAPALGLAAPMGAAGSACGVDLLAQQELQRVLASRYQQLGGQSQELAAQPLAMPACEPAVPPPASNTDASADEVEAAPATCGYSSCPEQP